MNTPSANRSTDLTEHPPRSPRVRLGGYTILPRVLDKARATLTGRQGDYKFNSPLDQVLFAFTRVSAEDLLAAVKDNPGDFDVLQWLHGKAQRSPHEVATWSSWTETFTDSGVEGRQWLADVVGKLDARRDDIHTIFDYLDLDDYLSFSGAK